MSKEENNQTDEEWVKQIKDLIETMGKESLCNSRDRQEKMQLNGWTKILKAIHTSQFHPY